MGRTKFRTSLSQRALVHRKGCCNHPEDTLVRPAITSNQKDTFAYQMGASLSGNSRAINYSNCVIQLRTTLLKPAFYRPSPGGNASVRGQDELHERRHEGEEVVPPLVNHLPAAVRHVALPERDLARVDGILHDRGADEHGRFPVRIRERGLARPLDAGEGERTKGP